MAIRDDAPQNNAAPAYGTVEAAAPVNQAAVGGGQRWSFFQAGNPGGISRSPTSEVLTKAKAKLEEFYKEKLTADKSLSIQLLAVDNSVETSLYLSGLIVAVRDLNDKALGVSYHTLLLEGSAEPLPPRIDNINNVQVQVDRFASDVMDERYVATVDAIVRKAFPDVAVRQNSAQVVPRSFNWEDADLLRDLAINAVYPSVTDLEQQRPSFQDVNLALWSHDSQLQTQLNFNEPGRTDYSGLPVRNDIAITLTAIDNAKANNQSVNTQERTKLISRLGGFMDLVWSPVVAQQSPYGVAPQGPQQKFAPRFVMTNLENVLRMTTASQLLAMVTAMTLRENNNWFPYFAPRPVAGGKTVDLRDIGAINFEANIFNDPSGFGPRIDTKSGSFTNQQLGHLLSSAIRPELSFSLDVSECGSDTWYNEVFAAAAAGSAAAADAILSAANELTGGAFARHYQTNESPVIVNEDRIHLGYYIGSDGQKHDIREIDYLAVLNLQGETDIGAAQAWSDTFLRLDYTLNKRLAERKKMIVDLVRGDVVFTGMARRSTMSARFLEALAASCREAGLDTRVTSPSFGGDYISQRASAGFLPQSAVPMGVSGLFNTGYSSQAAFGGAGRGFGTRWG